MLDILQALLAFALTMLALATVVTMIMETVARVLRRRGRVFRHMLTMVFEKEIWSRLGDKLTKENIERAIDTVQASPFMPEKGEGIARYASAKLNAWFAAHQSTNLTATEFLQRLSRTEIGTQLVKKYEGAEDKLEQELAKIEIRYDEIAAAASEWVKNSTAILSLVIGVGLAFAWNIDGGEILEFYITNPDRAVAVAGKADRYIKASEAAEQRLKTALEAIDKAEEGEEGKAAAKKAVEDIRNQYADIKKQGDSLLAEGLPMGLNFYPHCRLPAIGGGVGKDPRCLNEITVKDLAWLIFIWAPVVFITGVLIGLGGPFWYDAVTGLMRVTQMLRGREAAKPAEGRPAAGAGETKPEKNIADTFRDRHEEADDADPVPAEITANVALRRQQLDHLAYRIMKKTGKSPPTCRIGTVIPALLKMFQTKPEIARELYEQYEKACKAWQEAKTLEEEHRNNPKRGEEGSENAEREETE